MALFAALLCVSAYISISLPIPGAPHLTLVNFMVLLISFVLPAFQRRINSPPTTFLYFLFQH